MPLWAPLYGASFGEAVARFFMKYATFSGRASRSEYWWWALVSGIVSGVTNLLMLMGRFSGGNLGPGRLHCRARTRRHLASGHLHPVPCLAGPSPPRLELQRLDDVSLVSFRLSAASSSSCSPCRIPSLRASGSTSPHGEPAPDAEPRARQPHGTVIFIPATAPRHAPVGSCRVSWAPMGPFRSTTTFDRTPEQSTSRDNGSAPSWERKIWALGVPTHAAVTVYGPAGRHRRGFAEADPRPVGRPVVGKER